MTDWSPLKSRYVNSDSARKMLALDGGGIRGVLTLKILLEFENQLKSALGKDNSFRLSDFEHMIRIAKEGGAKIRIIDMTKT